LDGVVGLDGVPRLCAGLDAFIVFFGIGGLDGVVGVGLDGVPELTRPAGLDGDPRSRCAGLAGVELEYDAAADAANGVLARCVERIGVLGALANGAATLGAGCHVVGGHVGGYVRHARTPETGALRTHAQMIKHTRCLVRNATREQCVRGTADGGQVPWEVCSCWRVVTIHFVA
jgi:hypothetical protein